MTAAGKPEGARAVAMVDAYRSHVADLPVVPKLEDAAGAMMGVLIEAWHRITDEQRQVLAGAVAVVERYAGGNTMVDMVNEKAEAETMAYAASLLRRLAGRR